jgi:hypothetical protein
MFPLPLTERKPEAIWYRIWAVRAFLAARSICCCRREVITPDTTAVIRKNSSRMMSLLLVMTKVKRGSVNSSS